MTTQAQSHVTRASEQDHLFTLDPTRTYPVLDRADGVHVWDTDGNQYLDAVAGLGVVNIGYGRREVADAIAAQAAKMPFNAGNIFSQRTGDSRLRTASPRLTPGDVNYVHFTSGGSEAVEVALKMARQYHVERGEPERDKVIGRWTSYHGATLGGLSVGGAVLRRAQVRADAARHAPHPADLLLSLPVGPDATRRARSPAPTSSSARSCASARDGWPRSSRSRSSRRSAARSSPSPSTSRRSARSAIATACC